MRALVGVVAHAGLAFFALCLACGVGVSLAVPVVGAGALPIRDASGFITASVLLGVIGCIVFGFMVGVWYTPAPTNDHRNDE